MLERERKEKEKLEKNLEKWKEGFIYLLIL
jgi:hypothetical protein